MPFMLGCLALAAPRLTIAIIVLFSDYIGDAYDTTLVPFIGFLFTPLTTLAYAWAINSHGSVAGFYLFVVVVAVLIDFGLVGGSASKRRRRERTQS